MGFTGNKMQVKEKNKNIIYMYVKLSILKLNFKGKLNLIWDLVEIKYTTKYIFFYIEHFYLNLNFNWNLAQNKMTFKTILKNKTKCI